MRWVTAQDLQDWSRRLDSESKLPELIRRLVHATTEGSRSVAFPSGESIQTGGWDGIVHAPGGGLYVPDGWSGWELSKREDVTRKANEDYDTRTHDPASLVPQKTNFVFVTPRRWNAKEAWVAEKKAAGFWADVRGYDADDLEQWLEQSPAVGAWLARNLNKYPSGVLSIDDYWTEYSVATNPPFTAEIVLASREENAERATQWLKEGASTLFVEADSPREAFAVIAASTTLLDDEEQAQLRSQFLLADDLDVLREIVTAAKSLIIGWLAADTSSLGLAIHRGHRVILPTRGVEQHGAVLRVSRPKYDALLKALTEAGVGEDRATVLIREAGQSITVLHRQLNRAPVIPEWARPAVAHELIPADMASSWDEQTKDDALVLAQLGGTDYGTINAVMTRWSHVPDAPVQRTGTVWTVRAPRDAWLLLHSYVTHEDLKRYQAGCLGVFCTEDPSLELPPEERWLANVKGKEWRYSLWLRRGLAQTLIQIGLTPTIAGYRGADVAANIVHDVLEGDWRRWYSVEPILPHFAEAAPTTFLNALEDIIEREPKGISLLFEAQGPMHPNHATGLLWALELLAWYPEHLTRASALLAILGREHKRPKEILRAIFLPWLPQTGASVLARNAALTVLVKQDPSVVWEVLMGLWPQDFDSGSYHYEPQWREVSKRPRTMADYVAAVRGVVDLALQTADHNPERLCDIIKSLGTAPPEARQQLRERLATFPHDDANGRQLLLNTLRNVVNQHRRFRQADWALSEEQLQPFDEIVTALLPADLIQRHRWLFDDIYPMLAVAKDDDIDKALFQHRKDAIEEIVETRGLADVEELARRVKYPGLVGFANAALHLDEARMLTFLTSDEDPLRVCGVGYAGERYREGGLAWIDQCLAAHPEWSALTCALLLLVTPNDRQAWERVARRGADEEYWSRMHLLISDKMTPEDVTYAFTQLLKFGQISQAFERAGMTAQRVPTPVLRQVLDHLLGALRDGDRSLGHLTSYYLVHILGELDRRADIDEGAMARYEWAFLPLLRNERALRLHAYLATAPDLFAEMIATIYRSRIEGKEEAATEEQKARARQAYELLDTWANLPGKAPDGTINQEALFNWVNAACTACEDRREVCDSHIGRVLADPTPGADGLWPHESVRAVIEHVRSRSLENGFRGAILSSRGVYSKNPFDGGTQERALAAKYREMGVQLAPGYPRTAAVLAEVAEVYERHAQGEDHRSEQDRLRR